MNKKLFFFLPLLLLPLTSCSGTNEFDENNIILSAQLISDEHVSRTSPVVASDVFKNALNNFKEMSGKSDFDVYLSCGDHTMEGKLDEQGIYLDSLIEVFPNANNKLFSAHGNHDVKWTNCATREEIYDYCNENYNIYSIDSLYSNPSSGNRHAVINGINFITIDIDSYGANKNNVTQETADWFVNLMEQIKEENSAKPIFVLGHAPVKNTVFGSDPLCSTGIWGSSTDLDEIFSDYPNIIYLSGHTHYSSYDERSIFQDKYTAINVPSISGGLDVDYFFSGEEEPTINQSTGKLESDRYVYNAPDGGHSSAYQYPTGYLLEVDKDFNTRIKRFDLGLKQEIKENKRWIISAPNEDNTHLNKYRFDTRISSNSAPYLQDGNNGISYSYNNETKLYTLSFDTFYDDDMVYAYEADLYKLSSSNQDISGLDPDSKWVIVDEFYKHPDPKTRNYKKCFSRTFPITCESDESILLRVIGYDSWNAKTIYSIYIN